MEKANQVAFVTGGSRGIGAAIVRKLAGEGTRVAFTYRAAQASAQALVAELTAAGAQAQALQVDVADAAALRAAIDQVAGQWGRLDVLVHNAGVFILKPVQDFTLTELDDTLAVNVRAAFVASQAAAAHMGEGGRIVHIGSCNAERAPAPGFAAYAMSKAAISGLTRGLARDLGPRGITVNNVQPGPVDTDMNPANGDHAGFQHSLMALPRHARPAEIADMVAYLASPAAAFVTGASLLIDGGFAA